MRGKFYSNFNISNTNLPCSLSGITSREKDTQMEVIKLKYALWNATELPVFLG